MPTGACGINCDVCKLKLLEICSSCGSGRSREASKKLEAQKRIFGGVCTILECACRNQKEYCLRDCNSFPCDNFIAGPYPYSPGFLGMQERRRQDRPPALNHHGTVITVPPEYWISLQNRDTNMLCNLTLASPYSSGGLLFHFLREDLLVDIENCCLKRLKNGSWEKIADPLLEMITLLYLNNVDSFHPLGKDIISPKDLKEAHFFKGAHELKIAPLLERYGNDMAGLEETAKYLEGQAIDMADAAYMLLPFPRVPLYYLFWKGDEEFESRISVLFDRSIENYLPAAGIWALSNWVSFALLKGPEKKLYFGGNR